MGDIKRSFVCADLVGNHNKIWKLSANDIGGGTYEVTYSYGRFNDGALQTTVKTQGLREIERTIHKKLNPPKGKDRYTEVEHHKVTVGTDAAPAQDPEVSPIVQNIFAAANENIQTYLSVNVDTLGLPQILRGRSQLKEIAALSRSRNHRQELLKAVQLYYTFIPTKLPRKIDVDMVVLDLCNHLDVQEERLLQLEAAVQSHAAAGSVESNFGAQLSLLSRTSSEYKRIHDYVEQTKRAHCGIYIKHILKAVLPLERAAYESETTGASQIEELFHGTPARNIRHILGTKNKQGLIVPAHYSNGRAFGNGVYFANVSTKSGQYCAPHNELSYLLIADVKVGRFQVPVSGRDDLKPDAGYDSIWAKERVTRKPGSTMDNDEIIVYRTSQQTIKYVVVFSQWR